MGSSTLSTKAKCDCDSGRLRASLSIAHRLPLSPMMLFAIGIEHAFDVPVKRPHDADARHHRRAAVAFGDQDQRFDRRLPLLELLFGLRQLLDISGRVLKRDKLAAAGERDRIFELALPAPIANDANLFYRIRF